MPSVEGLGARKAALRMLDAVLRKGQTLDSAASTARDLSPPDRALALAIAGETLRRLPDLDALIDGATRQRLPDDSKARMVLRLALAQKIGLGTAEHALVATALPLVDGGPRRLVHGVLGTLLRKGLLSIEAPRLPAPVEERWRAAWGEEVVVAGRAQIAQRPALDLSFGNDADAQSYATAHEGLSLAPKHVRLQSRAVADLPGYGEGRWWVQDLAASLPARLFPDGNTEVLDLCAAPGGKTGQLHGEVTAVEIDPARARELRENLERMGRSDVTVVEADGTALPPDLDGFDRALVDAPCSGLGVLAGRPDLRWRAQPLPDLQVALVRAAAERVRLGGSVTFSVCTLNADENEDVVDAVGLAVDDLGSEWPAFAHPKRPEFLLTTPHRHGTSGFFIARMRV